MPRSSRYGPGRGTHEGKGVLSGSSVGTIPSGVTLTRAGLQVTASATLSPTELAYLDAAVTKVLGFDRVGYFVETGVVDGVKTTYTEQGAADVSRTLNVIFTNISTGVAFFPVVKADAAASAVSYCTWEWSKNGTAFTGASVYCQSATGWPRPCIAGSSISWLAIGK